MVDATLSTDESVDDMCSGLERFGLTAISRLWEDSRLKMYVFLMLRSADLLLNLCINVAWVLV